MGLETYAGVADCHGIESFQRKSDMSSFDRSCRLMRAAANGQRHAIYYEVTMESAAAKIVEGYLQDGDYEDALHCLKRVAIEFSVLPEHEKNLHMIPEPALDPYA